MDTPRRVLVADADADSRMAYRQWLTGCEVQEAADGREALTKALVHVPELVITELRLPIIDGLALCEILRQDRTTARVPLLVATIESSRTALERAREIADAVIAKPTDGDALRSETARLLAVCRGLADDLSARCSESVGTAATLLRIATELRRDNEIRRRQSAAKTHVRFTTRTPPTSPPVLTCPACRERPLVYDVSYVGGVNERRVEQWDYYNCPSCGGFQYRQRTRKLRPLSHDEQRWLMDLGKSRQ